MSKSIEEVLLKASIALALLSCSAKRHISLDRVYGARYRRHRDLTEEMSLLLGRFGKPQDSKFQCLDHCLGPVGDPQLRDDVLDVILSRAKAYYKIRSNLAVGASQLHES